MNDHSHAHLETTRRQFCKAVLGAAVVPAAAVAAPASPAPFRLNYLLASAMYGKLPLAEVLPEVTKTGAGSIDIWRAPHADQREQIDTMGADAFAALLKKHDVRFAATTIWGKPFGDELRFVKKLGGSLLVTGFVPKSDAKSFVEKLKPQLAIAEEAGVTVAIENHGADADAIRSFADAAAPTQLKVALAPYHLPQDAKLLAKLIEDIGPTIALFYAWQHGMGAMKKLPKEQELLQLPGRGGLDFKPLLAALKKAKFAGWTEVFMHPVPRGIPIHETAAGVTAEINRSRAYLEDCLEQL